MTEANPRILIIDDDLALAESLVSRLRRAEYTADFCNDGAGARRWLSAAQADVILLDLNLPDTTGLDFLDHLRGTHPEILTVMITGQQDMKTTIDAMRRGAFDYLRKPFRFDELLITLEKAQARRQARKPETEKIPLLPVQQDRHEIVGGDPTILEVIKQIGLLSRSRVTVLIEGESGTGKELVARALHSAGEATGPLVAINCSGVVANLLESELFGHEKGAFTGATGRKTGLFEHAGEGTVFLDEIGDMPLELQAKLLRVIQEREFQRVGGLEPVPFRARVVAATNRNLEELIKEGSFREDLFFRLAVSRISIPPLRKRLTDIPLLVRYLVDRITRQLHRPMRAVDPEAIKRLMNYSWPGNIRELENVLTRAVALAQDDVLTAQDLGCQILICHKQVDGVVLPLWQAEKIHIEKALAALDWNVTHTADALEISPTTLRKKIKDYGIKK